VSFGPSGVRSASRTFLVSSRDTGYVLILFSADCLMYDHIIASALLEPAGHCVPKKAVSSVNGIRPACFLAISAALRAFNSAGVPVQRKYLRK